MRRTHGVLSSLIAAGCAADADPPAPAAPERPVLVSDVAATADDWETFRDCAACPEMVVVPAGQFVMGSPEGEIGRFPDERPQHGVQVAAFAAGRFEVTWDEWKACVRGGGCDSLGPDDEGWEVDGALPAIGVSWIAAQAYLQWLSGETGRDYRLLSEAEWEYAARGKTNGSASEPAFWWGDTASSELANHRSEAEAQGRDRWSYTAPVGSFPANPFGLHDMNGNVWEWVEDCWHFTYEGAPTDGSAWTDGCSSITRETSRVRRGGSWANQPRDIRAAIRIFGDPARQDDSTGFRVARSL